MKTNIKPRAAYLAAKSQVELQARCCSVHSAQQGRIVNGATEAVYVRKDLIGRLQRNPQLLTSVIPVCVFAQYGKTTLGRAYTSRFRWVLTNLQSLYELCTS